MYWEYILKLNHSHKVRLVMSTTNDNNDNESTSTDQKEARPGRPDTSPRDAEAPQDTPDLPPGARPGRPDTR